MIKKFLLLICFFFTLKSYAIHFEAQVHLVNFSPEQAAKLKEAIELVKKVVVSEEFKQRVLMHSFEGKRTFVDNKNFTNEQIYQLILEGAETLMPTKNSQMDLELELYEQSTNTIGYTYPNTSRIWMNTKYFDKYTPVQIADNLFHEWMHKLGFDHATVYSTQRNYSVPYALGYLIEELAYKYYTAQK